MVEYDPETKEGKCIFCEMAKANIPPMGNGLIYEDEKFMAWLSPFPNTKGFAVVIPKKHYGSDVLKMPDEELKEFVLVAKKVAQLLENYFEDVGRVGLMMEGTGINHAHIKLFPMHGTEHMKKGEWKQINSDVETYFEKYEGYMMSNDAPQADLKEIEELAKNIRESNKN